MGSAPNFPPLLDASNHLIVRANPDGLQERPTIGINGHWPLPVMTATVGDTVVVTVNNQLGQCFHALESRI
jgi:FtsP/CotA-like multicopper oxidase with cupredoxin domain